MARAGAPNEGCFRADYPSVEWVEVACENVAPRVAPRPPKKAGKALGDRHLEAKGKAEKAEGHIRSGVGKAKDAMREAAGKQ